MTDARDKHLDQFSAELGKAITQVFNEGWKKLPRTGSAADRAVALDAVAMGFDSLASGLSALAERCRDRAEDLLDSAGV
jgi:hypothetical protein